MPLLIGVLVVVGIVVVLGRAAGSRWRGAGRIKCDGCRHLRRKFPDGVMCGYGSREVFKTMVHVRMCGDRDPER